MNKHFTAGVLVLALFGASCNFEYKPFVENTARQTQHAEDLATMEAIYGTRQPTQPLAIIDEYTERWCGLISCETETPSPEGSHTPTVEETSNPATGPITIDGLGREWVRYYYSSSLDDQSGVVESGSIWPLLSQSGGSIEIELRGWVPQEDLQISGDNVYVNPCILLTHDWEHLDGPQCHTHIWVDHVLAQVPSSTAGMLVSSVPTNRNYRNTLSGDWTFGPMVEVVFSSAWIPAENGDLP